MTSLHSMCAAAALVGLVAPMQAFATTSEQGRPTATTKEPEIKVAPICPSCFFDGFDEAAKAPLKEPEIKVAPECPNCLDGFDEG